MNGLDNLQTLDRSVLADQITRIISDGLLNGYLCAGDRLVEGELAQRLGVSRSPVREALADLQRCGLVQREPGRGAVIRKWTEEDLRELYVVRGRVEGFAARLAVERNGSNFDLTTLERCVEQMHHAVEGKDYRRIVQQDIEFHQEIWRLSGSTLVNNVLDNITQAIRFFLTLNWTLFKDVEHIPQRHEKIIQELRRGDPDIAERVVSDHVQVARTLKALQKHVAGLPIGSKRKTTS